MMTLESKPNRLNLELPEVDKDAVEENRKYIEREYPELLEFNPREKYAYDNNNHQRITVTTHCIEIGRIANLVRRMAERGATADELNRAIRHSFVVCDAMKHDLDWRRSMEDFGIKELERKYSCA